MTKIAMALAVLLFIAGCNSGGGDTLTPPPSNGNQTEPPANGSGLGNAP